VISKIKVNLELNRGGRFCAISTYAIFLNFANLNVFLHVYPNVELKKIFGLFFINVFKKSLPKEQSKAVNQTIQ